MQKGQKLRSSKYMDLYELKDEPDGGGYRYVDTKNWKIKCEGSKIKHELVELTDDEKKKLPDDNKNPDEPGDGTQNTYDKTTCKKKGLGLVVIIVIAVGCLLVVVLIGVAIACSGGNGKNKGHGSRGSTTSSARAGEIEMEDYDEDDDY